MPGRVLPATLAVAEELGVDGRRFIEALVAGYEVASRLGGASQVRPNVHSHGAWGTAGAAAAVARLRGHDAAAIRTVINLATSMSPANSWMPCFEGAVNPRTREELEAKFRALASEALEARRAEEVVEIVARLEDVKDVRAVTALLTSAS